ncbi:bifunctional 2-keto-4-hydroxyglutarate aldolase/2-keto-3-deoxy-6-phosphogluconate aldolase, partial [Listeria monocytogenes]|nr:bifunctional 2-keto-4-hydroxyglutarate aldolase/2-keto-3-deoxy-6-phosphogluconate aldolase [Listeria monocytogenes]
MKKVANLMKLKESGVIAVVRGASKEEALQASKAIVAGGITGIELTFTVPQAADVIAELV